MPKARFLLDANLSSETAIFLRSLNFDAKSLLEDGLVNLDDTAVAELARKSGRALITFDLDFGEMYYFSTSKTFSVVVLRLNDQRVEAVNRVLRKFLETYGSALGRKKKNLFVVSEGEVRVVD